MAASQKSKASNKKPKSSTKAKPATSVAPAAKEIAPARKRFLRLPKRLTKNEKQVIKDDRTKLPSAFSLFVEACSVLKQQWKLFGGILLIYGIVTLILVGSISGGTDLQSIKKTVGHTFSGQFEQLGAGLAIFAFLAGSSSSTSNTAQSAYQGVLLLLISVIFIWTLRQVYAGHKVRVRDAFYEGSHAIVPFILVLCVVGLQLIPLLLGTSLYGAVVGGSIAITLLEKVIFGGIALLLAVVSFYFICSSVMALYIVTLPGVAPMKALRSAKELVRLRRWIVLRKLLFLPVAVLVLMAFITIPFAVTFTGLASTLFFILSIVAVGFIHSYLYALYRHLL